MTETATIAATNMFVLYLIGGILTVATSLLFYEVARLAARGLPELRLHPHAIAALAILILFACHSISIALYAIAYMSVRHFWPELGSLISPEIFPGEYDGHFQTILYFSAATYTSLGYGDIVPHGALRTLGAIEALNGLVLIGWSASFGYILMSEFWKLHGNSRPPAKKKTRD